MNKLELEKLASSGISISKISKITNKSKTSVRYWLNKFNLKTNPFLYKSGNIRTCPFCKMEKEISFFYNRRGKEGNSSYCKECTHIICKKKREMNKKETHIPRKHTEETKKKISDKIKKYLSENPESHVWKRNDKFKSTPCENFKDRLNILDIRYIPEMTISTERHFSIDIALIDYKIAIEINGNQHYDKDGSLKDYYKIRNKFISNLGWKVLEIHYSICLNNENIDKMINDILDKNEISEFDYKSYLLNKEKRKKEKYLKNCKCGLEIGIKSKMCKKCTQEKRRKVERPSLEILLEQVNTLGFVGTSKIYGVSDNCIRKWIK